MLSTSHVHEGDQEGGKSGAAIVPLDPDASRMIQRIESEACPPRDLLLKFFVKRPPTDEIEVLRDWIAAGAPEVDVQTYVATTEPDLLVTRACVQSSCPLRGPVRALTRELALKSP